MSNEMSLQLVRELSHLLQVHELLTTVFALHSLAGVPLFVNLNCQWSF